MSKKEISPRYLPYYFAYVLLVLTFMFSSCSTNNIEEVNDTTLIEVSHTPSITNSPTPKPDTRLSAEFLPTRLLGSSYGIFCAELLSDYSLDEVGFLLQTADDKTIIELQGVCFEDAYYVQVNNLTEDTDYQLKMYYVEDGIKEYTKNNLCFKTPKKIYTEDEVNNILLESIEGKSTFSDDMKQQIATIQRALNLINTPCGNLGVRCYNLQINQIKLEYSFNSYNRYTNWDKIDGECDQDTVNILKDIISVNQNLKYTDLFCPFVPSPHSLSSYNKHDEKGGQFDAESYLYDNLVNDDVAYSSYLEYPFIYDSHEFQDKYSKIIKDNEGNEELSVDINHAIAENKFLFSYFNRAYMDKYAIPQDRVIEIYYAGGLTVQTAAAFSYLISEVPKGYDRLHISTSLRNYNSQAHFYTKGSGMNNAVDYGDYWHLFRQSNSYVPGFSNHQYGIAIDFNDIQTFKSNSLYKYLQENANAYGFYNYYREAWHWVYLGE